jgi:hypothetical protein
VKAFWRGVAVVPLHSAPGLHCSENIFLPAIFCGKNVAYGFGRRKFSRCTMQLRRESVEKIAKIMNIINVLKEGAARAPVLTKIRFQHFDVASDILLGGAFTCRG